MKPGRPGDDHRGADARTRAEAASREVFTKPIEGPAPPPIVPGAQGRMNDTRQELIGNKA